MPPSHVPPRTSPASRPPRGRTQPSPLRRLRCGPGGVAGDHCPVRGHDRLQDLVRSRPFPTGRRLCPKPAAGISEVSTVNPADFLIQRAAAYQAYYEAMPLRASCLPQGPHLQLYRKASFGRLAEFLVLDTRQYRTD